MDHADDGEDGNNVFVYMGGNQQTPWNVTHVRVHKSVKIIRARAFRSRWYLVSIEMHDGVEIIEEEAFAGCTSLRGMNLAGVRVIEYRAFFKCIRHAFSETGLDDVEFGDKLESIGQYAFSGTALRSLKMPKVRVIGPFAFYCCEQLTEVDLSEFLERIQGYAFARCRRLNRIAIPLKDNMFESDDVFSECEDLSQVDLVGGDPQNYLLVAP